MTIAMPSGSKIELAIHCVYWLREGAGPHNEYRSKAADDGTKEHAFIEATMRTGEVTAKSPTHERWIDDWYIPHGSDGPWLVELGLAMNEDGVILIGDGGQGSSGDRYPWVPPGFIAMTVDAAQLVIDGTPVEAGELDEGPIEANEIALKAIDWKSGFRARTHLSRARRNLQINMIGAVMAERWLADRVELGIMFVRPDGVWVDEHRPDVLALSRLRSEIRAMMSALADSKDEARLAPKRGPWCVDKFCPLLGRCPATAGALVRVSPELAKLKIPRSAYEIQSQDHATELYHALRAAQASMKELWHMLARWQDETGPVRVRDGIAWGRRESRRESIDLNHPGAMDAMFDVLGDHWREAVNFSTAKVSSKPGSRSIHSGARLEASKRSLTAPKRVTISSVEEELLARLREIGAATTRVSSKVDEYAISESDVENYPWLTLDPDGVKVVERLDPDDDDDEDGTWES